MIDMKKKMAIVLSAVLACSMSITAVAAPSPTIAQDTVQNVTVNTSISTITGTPQITGIELLLLFWMAPSSGIPQDR